MKQKLILFVVITIFITFFAGCNDKKDNDNSSNQGQEASQPVVQPSNGSSNDKSDDEDSEIIKRSLKEVLAMEDATEIVETGEGVSFISALSFDETVSFYKDAIDYLGVEGKEQTLNSEELKVNGVWKFDGSYEDEMFVVSVAWGGDDKVGVAILYPTALS